VDWLNKFGRDYNGNDFVHRSVESGATVVVTCRLSLIPFDYCRIV
jgi:hypothetical protein